MTFCLKGYYKIRCSLVFCEEFFLPSTYAVLSEFCWFLSLIFHLYFWGNLQLPPLLLNFSLYFTKSSIFAELTSLFSCVEGVRKLRHLFLFNDVLVCAKYKAANRGEKFTFQLKWHIPLSEVGTGAVKISSPFSSSGTYPYQRWALEQ